MLIKYNSKPCLAAVGVGASFRLLAPHFSNEIDGLRSTKGWGASTSQGANGRDIAAPVTGPQRGSEKIGSKTEKFYDTKETQNKSKTIK